MKREEAVLSASIKVQEALCSPFCATGKDHGAEEWAHTGCLSISWQEASLLTLCLDRKLWAVRRQRHGGTCPGWAKLLHTLPQISAGNKRWPGSQNHRKDHVCSTRKWLCAALLSKILSDILLVNSAQWIPEGQNGRCCSSSVTERKPFCARCW